MNEFSNLIQRGELSFNKNYVAAFNRKIGRAALHFVFCLPLSHVFIYTKLRAKNCMISWMEMFKMEKIYEWTAEKNKDVYEWKHEQKALAISSNDSHELREWIVWCNLPKANFRAGRANNCSLSTRCPLSNLIDTWLSNNERWTEWSDFGCVVTGVDATSRLLIAHCDGQIHLSSNGSSY